MLHNGTGEEHAPVNQETNSFKDTTAKAGEFLNPDNNTPVNSNLREDETGDEHAPVNQETNSVKDATIGLPEVEHAEILNPDIDVDTNLTDNDVDTNLTDNETGEGLLNQEADGFKHTMPKVEHEECLSQILT